MSKKTRRNNKTIKPQEPYITSVVIPRRVNLKVAKQAIESYRSNVSNMFTSNERDHGPAVLACESFGRCRDCFCNF